MAGFTACVCSVGVATYFAMWMGWVNFPFQHPVSTNSKSDSTPSESGPTATPAVNAGLAMRYAQAIQDGNCDEILRMTSWMVDRMRRVALESSDPAVIEATRAELCAQIRSRVVEGNVLRLEGIEDQYVFAPGATLEVVGRDDGRTDLSGPVAYRTWIQVTYPNSRTAPLVQDPEGNAVARPVRSWNVGINVSRADNTIMKAGVVGNLDIDFSSFSFEWPDGK